MTPVNDKNRVKEEKWQGVTIVVCFPSIPVGRNVGLCAVSGCSYWGYSTAHVRPNPAVSLTSNEILKPPASNLSMLLLPLSMITAG